MSEVTQKVIELLEAVADTAARKQDAKFAVGSHLFTAVIIDGRDWGRIARAAGEIALMAEKHPAQPAIGEK